ncbi:hypothetical protein D9V30_13740 [Mycetocola reblochoni]|uniref:Prepilin type IV endopeptidase peptidase domain-containing protein n=2 Tax=Mycetocola reblochoni TaxID=331618 RepID=A0A3L6ZIQ2_9MICO|nr:hypothetical protein D9V30_13740 [Mycetocola reblochoni]SJN16949.1 putative integral membrane peptidase [Mycetocola reblochoni REB411]
MVVVQGDGLRPSRREIGLGVCLAVLVALAGARSFDGLLPTLVFAAPALVLAVVTPTLWRVDVVEHRLPDALVGPVLAVGAAAVAVQPERLPALLAVVAVLVVPLIVAALIGGMRLGDVKLSLGFALALAAGECQTALAVESAVRLGVIALLVGGGVAIAEVVRRGWRRSIPFGPALLVGFWTEAVVVGP